MPLEIPRIDDQNYEQILRNALARVRVHNPEWTNLNDSDPGVTLLQLFAFMTDSLLYRANLIPERNHKKFLTLLGIPPNAAAAAQGIVVLQNDRGPLRVETIPKDLELRAGQVPFRIDPGVFVLPVEGHVYYKRRLKGDEADEHRNVYAQFYGSKAASEQLEFYETTRLAEPPDAAHMPVVDLKADTVDSALWIALMTRPKEQVHAAVGVIAQNYLNIGILPGYDQADIVLPPIRTTLDLQRVPIVFELPTERETDDGLPVFIPLRVDVGKHNILHEPGVITVKLEGEADLERWRDMQEEVGNHLHRPPELSDEKEKARVITWIRMRIDGDRSDGGARISWMGINATEVTQKARVVAELVGKGTGEPDQSFTLVQRNVISLSMKLTVGQDEWHEIDDLLAAGPEVSVRDQHRHPGAPAPDEGESRVFAVDHEAGVIRFGDGARGARPRKGAEIRASYDYGGGRQGNVPIGAINKAPTLPPGFKVTNPLPTWGGAEPESVAAAEKNIPRYLRHRDRLVTIEDFDDIVRRTPGVDIGRVEVLPNFNWHFPRKTPLAGAVTVLVIPRRDDGFEGIPKPDRFFLKQIGDHIDQRRLITTEVLVIGPDYKTVDVFLKIFFLPGFDRPKVSAAVTEAVSRFLSPLRGGRDGKGWQLGRRVHAMEIEGEAERVEGVRSVKATVGADSGSEPTDHVDLDRLQLPWLHRLDARPGDVGPADGEGKRPTPRESSKVVPVPIIPKDC